MTTPNALTPTPGVTTSWHPTYEYRVNSGQSTSTYTVYSLYHVTNAGFVGGVNASYGIYVLHSTDTWYDASDLGTGLGADVPDSPLTVNGTSIELYDGSTLLYSFVKPTTASWIGGGGGFLSNSDDDEPPPKVFHNFW